MHHLSANSSISLTLMYTDSNGESFKCEGTGKLNSNSFADPSLPKHQIMLSSVSFPDLGISNATFRIQPQYDVIYISCSQLSDSSSQQIADINIKLNIDQEPIVSSPIKSDFIGPDIARVDKIPTTTSELTNDSGYITDYSLTDYLQTDTFKDIYWSNIDNTGNSKHDLELKVSGTGGPGENGEYYLRLRNYSSAGEVANSVLVSPTFGFDARIGNKDARLTPSQLLMNDPDDNERTYVSSGGITIKGNMGSSAENSILFASGNMSINGKVIYYKDLQTASDVSTAISSQTKETWTFTLADGSTVTKSVVLG